jgi:phosphonate transport system substrate-binding protein
MNCSFESRPALVVLLALAMMTVACARPADADRMRSAAEGPGAGRDPDVLKVALLPDESPATIIKDNQPLKDYLEKELHKSIELTVTTDYSSMIEAVRHGRIDVAYFGPLSYCLAKSKREIEPFAAKLSQGASTYRAVLIVQADSGIESLADVKGAHVAFGDTASTSSHLIPKAMLAKAGLLAGRDYEATFVGNHDAVALNVAQGHAQVGGLSKPIFESLVEREIVDAEKVRVLAESDLYPQYPWVMQSDLADELKQRIRQAFYGLRDESALKALKAEGFAAVSDADYDPIRELAKLLHLDLSKAP